jgi:hypothetical protein
MNSEPMCWHHWQEQVCPSWISNRVRIWTMVIHGVAFISDWNVTISCSQTNANSRQLFLKALLVHNGCLSRRTPPWWHAGFGGKWPLPISHHPTKPSALLGSQACILEAVRGHILIKVDNRQVVWEKGGLRYQEEGYIDKSWADCWSRQICFALEPVLETLTSESKMKWLKE